MKYILLVTVLFSFSANAQQALRFPGTWKGNWKGELEWFKTGTAEPEKINMELRIRAVSTPDSADTWTWQIIYGSEAEDNRPYKLIQKDTAGIHWAIDENNGIVLDQYLVAGKFSGAFTVMNSTIINSYWMEGNKLHVEFYSISAKPVNTTGKGTEESPSVNSYKVGSYQKAVLLRSK
ncbi:MAG: hypothetical protein HOP10_03395 [Chitinophagaceae bacterium]|nr:hypothetical protein [Chitinophagaceae bacterium]